jgi:hypothetical protein
MKHRLFILFILICFIIACHNDKIIITRDYVHNENFQNFEIGLLSLCKIKLHDSTIDINKNFNPFTLRAHDTINDFCYKVFGKINEDKTIYFDNRQDSLSWFSCKNSAIKRETIGRLELNSWYKFDGLKNLTEIYTFIDVDGKSHIYQVNIANW